MKRLLSALLVLLLLCSSAFAADDAPIASYGLPDGAEVYYVAEENEIAIPDGLNGLYSAMLTPVSRGDLYLIRMPNGRALSSVSCTPVYESVTPEQMLALWPKTVEKLTQQGLQVDESATTASVETAYDGIAMLHAQARICADGLWLEAEGFAFCREYEITEIWAVCPESGLYSGDSAEAGELLCDRRDLKIFMDSLSFPETWEDAATGVPFEDRDGRFALAIPQDAVVIDIHSTPEEVEAARALYVEKNPEGAAHAFDYMMQDVQNERTVLIFTADMQGVIHIFASHEPDFSGFTAEDLCQLAAPIEQMMQDSFEVAACLAPNERAQASGLEHALMGYWLRSGELDLMLDIMACVTEDDWLYEVDVYASEGDQNVRTVLHAFVQQTLLYTPPQNGLD